MIKGVNIDITNDPPDIDELYRLTWIDAIRFPSRPGIDDYIAEANRLGIFTLAVVDGPSNGFICGNGECSAYQIRNEPDGNENLTIEQCREELRIYRQTYPDLVLLGPGLAAGDYTATYLKGIVQALRDYNYGGWSIHPYNKTPTGAASLFTAHQKVATELPGLYTECHPESDSLRQFYKSARDTGCTGVFYHCWNDVMTHTSEGIDFGLVDLNNKPKRSYHIFTFV